MCFISFWMKGNIYFGQKVWCHPKYFNFLRPYIWTRQNRITTTPRLIQIKSNLFIFLQLPNENIQSFFNGQIWQKNFCSTPQTNSKTGTSLEATANFILLLKTSVSDLENWRDERFLNQLFSFFFCLLLWGQYIGFNVATFLNDQLCFYLEHF